MALIEMYDYLTTVTPNYTSTTLQVTPSNVLVESMEFPQIVNEMDDGTVIITTLSDKPKFIVSLQWDYVSLDDTGTILDFFLNTSKAKGLARSFYWKHPLDGHTYVVKFASPPERSYQAGFVNYATISRVTLRVIGRKAD